MLNVNQLKKFLKNLTLNIYLTPKILVVVYLQNILNVNLIHKELLNCKLLLLFIYN